MFIDIKFIRSKNIQTHQLSQAIPVYCATIALGGYPWHFDKIYYIWMVTDICLYMWHHLLQTMAIITPMLVTHPILLQLPADICSVSAKPPVSHIIGSFTTASSITSACQRPWPNPEVPIILETEPWKVVESNTMEILSGDKVPLGDNKSVTSRNCI